MRTSLDADRYCDETFRAQRALVDGSQVTMIVMKNPWNVFDIDVIGLMREEFIVFASYLALDGGQSEQLEIDPVDL